MKRVLTFFLILSIIFCCSCGDKTQKKKANNHSANTSQNASTGENGDSDSQIDGEEDGNDNSASEIGGKENGTASQELSWNSTIYSPSSTDKNKVVKSRIPDGVTQFNGDYNNYFTVCPKEEHPGVVNFDAYYEMQIYDYNGKSVALNDVSLKVNNPNVTVIGSTLIVPYAVRKGYDRVEVTVQDKKDAKKKGKYRFDFLQFTDTATFADDFSVDTGNWVKDTEGGNYDLGLPVIKDGFMEMTIAGKEMNNGIRSAVNYKQAYGSFSANMKLPANSNVIGSFWLFTSSGYIPNPEAPGSTVGEIDIVEFATGSSTAMFTVHWFDYGSFHQENSTSTQFAYNGSKFYTFSVVWAPGKIFWYIDGKLYKTATGVDEGAGNGRGGMYPILQAGYYSDFRGFNPVDTLPATVYVDWVEIYGLVMD